MLIETDLDQLARRYVDQPVGEIEMAALRHDNLAVLRQHRLRLPSDLALLAGHKHDVGDRAIGNEHSDPSAAGKPEINQPSGESVSQRVILDPADALRRVGSIDERQSLGSLDGVPHDYPTGVVAHRVDKPITSTSPSRRQAQHVQRPHARSDLGHSGCTRLDPEITRVTGVLAP